MAQVTLQLVSNKTKITLNPVTLSKGEQLEFVASDGNLYTVTIDDSKSVFDTLKNLLIYDVSPFLDSRAITPIPKPNLDLTKDYSVVVTTSDNAYKETDAPPRIIINSL